MKFCQCNHWSLCTLWCKNGLTGMFTFFLQELDVTTCLCNRITSKMEKIEACSMIKFHFKGYSAQKICDEIKIPFPKSDSDISQSPPKITFISSSIFQALQPFKSRILIMLLASIFSILQFMRSNWGSRLLASSVACKKSKHTYETMFAPQCT